MSELAEPFATLVREHRTIEAVVTNARDAMDAAAGHAGEPEIVSTAFESLRDLEAFMDVDLALHIAKEEQVLFPALRVLGHENEVVVEDMLAQHDSVRERHEALQRTLAVLDDGHEDVRAEREALSAQLTGNITNETLATLREIVRRLDSILQGHFFDEEDGLFEPALTLVSPARLTELHDAMTRLEADSL